LVARTSLRLIPNPAHPPAVPRARFTEALSCLAATVCVVGAADQDARQGRTATAVISLSIDPPTLLVSIDRSSVLAGLIEQTEGFSVALLAEGQAEVAEAFAGKLGVPRSERFTFGQWDAWPSGRPRLAGAVANLDCHLIGLTEVATHILFVGLVTSVETTAASPLMWGQRRYRGLLPTEAAAMAPDAEG